MQIETIDTEFKGAVCAGLAQGYDPAIDAAGNPGDSVFHTSVYYLIGGRSLSRFVADGRGGLKLFGC